MISLRVEDGVVAVEPNGEPAVGVDRGVQSAVATSDGWMRDRAMVTDGEAKGTIEVPGRKARQTAGLNRAIQT